MEVVLQTCEKFAEEELKNVFYRKMTRATKNHQVWILKILTAENIAKRLIVLADRPRGGQLLLQEGKLQARARNVFHGELKNYTD